MSLMTVTIEVPDGYTADQIVIQNIKATKPGHNTIWFPDDPKLRFETPCEESLLIFEPKVLGRHLHG